MFCEQNQGIEPSVKHTHVCVEKRVKNYMYTMCVYLGIFVYTSVYIFAFICFERLWKETSESGKLLTVTSSGGGSSVSGRQSVQWGLLHTVQNFLPAGVLYHVFAISIQRL